MPVGTQEQCGQWTEEAVSDRRTAGRLDELGLTPRLIDVFAGGGGMTAGFTHFRGQVFQPVWAVDFDQPACNTYRANFGDHCVQGDICDLLADPDTLVPEADVVIGGPPCQGFSLLNKARAGDPRRELWRPFFEVVKRARASIFVMENVPQLLTSPEYSAVKQHAEGLGYQVAECKLVAADYGVPQTRQRAFVLGCNFADPWDVFPPKKTHYAPNPGRPLQPMLDEYVSGPLPWVTVRRAIEDLSEPVGTEVRAEAPPYDLHFGRTPTELSRQRYRAIPEEGMNRFDLLERAPELTPECWKRKKSGGTDLFGRLWWDRPSFTIRTEFFKPEKGRYLHPEQHRPITHREAARLQSFPDEFRFCGSKIQIARQIGNAVPPLLAARVADCVLALLLNREARDE